MVKQDRPSTSAPHSDTRNGYEILGANRRARWLDGIDAVAAMEQERQEPPWTAVSDRLPKKERDIWTWDGEIVGWIGSAGKITAEDLEGCTHWMPKVPPAPPKPPRSAIIASK